jgi:KDO2-lipid IV(A) lauroyltransferase
MPDQNFEEEHSMFLPFFGISTLSLTATSRFAQISGCVVLPIFAYFRENTFVMDIEIHPPLTPFPSGDVMKDTLAINQLLEAEIKKHPEQYLWIHRRFKATVENGKGFYE